MPIEQLMQMLFSVCTDTGVMIMAKNEYDKLKLTSTKSDEELIKDCHDHAMDFAEKFVKVHNDFIKDKMSGIQIAKPSNLITPIS